MPRPRAACTLRAWGLGLGHAGISPRGVREVDLEHDFMPVKLGPQEASFLGLGVEDTDWTQGLPWSFGGLPVCSHWPHPSPPFLQVDLPTGEPMLLELGTTPAGDPAEGEACLLDLQFMSLVDGTEAVYLHRMTPRWAWRTPDQGWMLLLDAEELWAMGFPITAEG